MFGYNLWGLICLACALWVIIDVWTKNKYSTAGKVVWTICAVLFNIITAIVYLIIRRK